MEKVYSPPQRVRSSDLCEQCQRMSILEMLQDVLNPHSQYFGIKALFATSDPNIRRRRLLDLMRNPNCPLCCLILQSLPLDAVIRSHSDRVQLCFYGAPAENLLELRLLSEGPTSATYLMLDLFLHDNYEGKEHVVQLQKPRLCFGLSQRSLESRKSPLSRVHQRRVSLDFERLKRWTSCCEVKHSDTCKPISRLKGQIPGLRLLDVAHRTIVPAPEGARYIALSYVWGQSIHTRPGLGGHLVHLPKTIEDALKVTLELGERFLWVDAYCLSQQEGPERSLGLRLMHRVYNNALLTIFALSSENADGGLPGVARESRNLSSQSSLFLDNAEILSFRPKRLKDHFMDARWSTRGWTMQEAYFSTRRLCFTEEEAFFWCEQSAFCETIEDDALPWEPRVWADESGPFNLPTARQMPATWRFSDYASLVISYRSRQLTFQNDALAAFEGIMSTMEELYSVKFSYGLPTNADFWLAMLWQHSDPFSSRITKFPSWSWAGWSGGVLFPWRHDFWADFSPIFPETRSDLVDLPEGHLSVSSAVASVLLARSQSHRWQLQAVSGEPIPLVEEHSYRNSMCAFDRLLGVSCDFGEPEKNVARRAEAMLVTNVAYHPSVYVMLLKIEGGVAYRLGPLKLTTQEWERLRPMKKTLIIG